MLEIKNDGNTLSKVKKIKKVRYLSKEFIDKLDNFFTDNFVFSIFDEHMIRQKLSEFLSIELPGFEWKITIDDHYSTPNPKIIINIDEFDFEVKIEL
jgi:hypothetical protein